MRKIRVYVDTSVFGGVEDEEFKKESSIFFERVNDGQFKVLVSDQTIREMASAPITIQNLLGSLPNECLEMISINDDVEDLATEYLKAKVVSPSHAADAKHVAAATLAGADIILSWNFKHLVNYNRVLGFNSVNMRLGYRPMTILSPLEVEWNER